MSCDLSAKDFPFDKPTCGLQFGSWSQSSAYLTVKKNTWIGGARLATNPSSGEMKLTAATAVELSPKLYSDQTAFSTVQISLSMERAYQYYTSRFMLPLMAISLVSFVAFWVPPSSRERLAFGTILVACEVLLAVMAAPRVPQVKDPVLFSTFVSYNLYFCFGALLVSCVSISLWNKVAHHLRCGPSCSSHASPPLCGTRCL